MAGSQGVDPLRLALDGGEDYELLFTVRPESEKQLMTVAETIGTRITAIGEIVGDNRLSIELNGAIESAERSGYEHLI
jgi:thiamine-monophosphate kinase